MKIRTDFVTNSSSSSFICDFCGDDVSGMDMSLSEAEMYECENGHTICECHIDNINWEEIVRDLLLADIKWNNNNIERYPEEKDNYTKENKENNILLSKLSEMPEDELIDMANDFDFRDALPAKSCPICNFTSMIDEDMKNYLLDKFNLTENDVINEVKSKFTNYNDFAKFIKGEK